MRLESNVVTEPVGNDQHPVDREQRQSHHQQASLLAQPLGHQGGGDVAETGGETEHGPHHGRGVLTDAGWQGRAGPANAGPTLEDEERGGQTGQELSQCRPVVLGQHL